LEHVVASSDSSVRGYIGLQFTPTPSILKWAEGLGQSLYYAAQTERQAGIVLTLAKGEERFFRLDRLNKTIKAHGLKVKVWVKWK
jgi:hypothetical protein